MPLTVCYVPGSRGRPGQGGGGPGGSALTVLYMSLAVLYVLCLSYTYPDCLVCVPDYVICILTVLYLGVEGARDKAAEVLEVLADHVLVVHRHQHVAHLHLRNRNQLGTVTIDQEDRIKEITMVQEESLWSLIK